MVAGEAGKLPASRVVLEGSIDDFSAFTPDVEPEEEGNNHSSSHDSSADSSLTGKVSLQEENELLKADVVLLKKEVARLRATSRQPPKSPPKKQALLPPSLRQAAGDNRRRRPHRKLSGVALNDNDMEAVRAEPDLEMHESGRGLHQRRHNHSNKTPSPVVEADSILSRFFADADTSQLIEDDEEEEGGLELACLVGDASDNTDGDCEVLIEPASEMTEPSFREQVQDRALWLVGLLVLQSMSSFIIARNESLLQHHVIIVRFLTMLVGAGGNAGNQASVRGTSMHDPYYEKGVQRPKTAVLHFVECSPCVFPCLQLFGDLRLVLSTIIIIAPFSRTNSKSRGR